MNAVTMRGLDMKVMDPQMGVLAAGMHASCSWPCRCVLFE